MLASAWRDAHHCRRDFDIAAIRESFAAQCAGEQARGRRRHADALLIFADVIDSRLH